jgi:tetraacyldisaccharide 4'-kinase
MKGGGRSVLFTIFAKIHRSSRLRPVVIFALFPLFIFSLIFGLIARVRVFLYRIGLFKSERLKAYVVSIGNLTTGGAGKTPVVMHIAEMLIDAGISPAVISRGYGFEVDGDYLVVSDGDGVKLSPGRAPDEALMTAYRLNRAEVSKEKVGERGRRKGVPVIVGPDRRLSGRVAVEDFGAEVVIMDDGYQHLKVKRDMNILVFDEENPVGNGLLLPAGPLREPLKAAKRADVVWINSKSSKVGRKDCGTGGFEDKLKRQSVLDIPVVKSALLPDMVLDVSGNTHPLGILNKKRVLAFSGIARPDSFFKTFDDLGSIVVYSMPFMDHYIFSEDDYRAIERIAFLYNAEMLVTTEKDMARIQRGREFKLPLFALLMSLSAEGDEAVINMVLSGLGRKGTLEKN